MLGSGERDTPETYGTDVTFVQVSDTTRRAVSICLRWRSHHAYSYPYI
jgi:hypothetical protein